MKRSRLLIMGLLGLAAPAVAQVPDTDIYIAPLRLRDGWVAIGTPRNITNRAGYDNQPHFTADGRSILYTARIAEQQTDIFRYDIRTGETVRLTHTPESEYSPTPVQDGFTVVRVEADSTQRVWRFDPSGGNPRLLFPGIKPVGYHAWIDSQLAALFVLGSPPTLQLANIRDTRAREVSRDIGRAIQRIPRWGGVSYVQRTADSTLWVYRVHGSTGESVAVAKLPPGGEFHAWTPRSALIATAGTRLLEWTPIDGGTWREVIDLSAQRIRVSRVAVSPRGDWIALVGERF